MFSNGYTGVKAKIKPYSTKWLLSGGLLICCLGFQGAYSECIAKNRVLSESNNYGFPTTKEYTKKMEASQKLIRELLSSMAPSENQKIGKEHKSGIPEILSKIRNTKDAYVLADIALTSLMEPYIYSNMPSDELNGWNEVHTCAIHALSKNSNSEIRDLVARYVSQIKNLPKIIVGKRQTALERQKHSQKLLDAFLQKVPAFEKQWRANYYDTHYVSTDFEPQIASLLSGVNDTSVLCELAVIAHYRYHLYERFVTVDNTLLLWGLFATCVKKVAKDPSAETTNELLTVRDMVLSGNSWTTTFLKERQAQQLGFTLREFLDKLHNDREFSDAYFGWRIAEWKARHKHIQN